jgi:hypothetical protein
MFWQKSLVLLGMLAAASIAAPVLPVPEDADVVDFVDHGEFADFVTTEKSLDGRNSITAVWRADSRELKQVVIDGGFFPKGTLVGKYDLSLYRHAKGKTDSFASMDTDGYVSTTSSLEVAEGWIKKYLKNRGIVYKIAAYPNLIDVQATLGHYNPFPSEKEFAGIHSIPWKQIMGWYRFTALSSGGTLKGQYEYNAHYDKAKYDNKRHGGAQYPLAGFPNNHQAWDQDPWALYAFCRPKNTMRSILGLEDEEEQTAPSGGPLIARKKVASKKTKAKVPKTKKPSTKKPAAHKPTTKKPTTKKPAAKCTAAQKKAGKCPAEKCTPAMKKAKKCPADKKGDCGPLKPTKDAYNEYVKLMNSGKPPAPGAKPKGGAKGKGGAKPAKKAGHA